MHTVFGPWTIDDLAVLEVAENEWRVSDLQVRQAAGPAFIGLVRQRTGVFYATNLPLRCPAHQFSDLESAVAFLENEYLSPDRDLEDTMPWPMPEN
jgi:hypothetical protein